MIMFYMIKIIVDMQFLLHVDIFEIIGLELEQDQMSMNKEHMNLSLFIKLV